MMNREIYPQDLAPEMPLPPLRVMQSVRDHVAKNALSMVDWANHKPANKGQKPKVGGHQASSMSSVDLLCALYLHALKPGDRLAVKPHAAPILYSLMHLMGQLPREQMYELREYKGPQPYPTELKNPRFVDYTTSSEALGVACTIYDAYGAKHHNRALPKRPPVTATYWAHCGDGELTEGQIDESLYDAGRWRLDNLVWIVDLNRQSLDRVMDDSGHLHTWVRKKFEGQGWHVLEARWGSRAEALFARPGGDALKTFLDGLDDGLLQPLFIARESQVRAVLRGDVQSPSIADRSTQYLLDLYRERVLVPASIREGLIRLVADLPEPAPDDRDGPLLSGMRHLGGHDLELLCLRYAEALQSDRPVCVIAHTIKGYETSAAAHPENHGGLLPSEEVAAWGLDRGLAPDPFPVPTDARALSLLETRAAALYPDALHEYVAPPVDVRAATADIPFRARSVVSSGEAFQSLNLALLKSDLAPYLQFGAPDVGQTTHLGVVIKQTGVFSPRDLPDSLAFLREGSGLSFDWRPESTGQFHAFGIAEGNAMLWAYAFGRRKKHIEGKLPVLPIVTVYDKFFERGFNQLDYAVYSNARFIAVGTPSGTGLSRETATHQSLQTLRMMMDLPGILAYEPAFAADLHAIYLHALSCLWDPDGEAFYLRLTTQPLEQPSTLPEDHAARAIRGAYWLIGEDERAPAPHGPEVRFVASGRKLKEVREAAALLHADGIGSRILNVTSYEALWRDWDAYANDPTSWDDPDRTYYLHDLFAEDDLNLPLIIVGDHVPSVAEWLPTALQRVVGHRFLGPRRNGEAGALPDIDHLHGMATSDIVSAARHEIAWRARHGLGARVR
jgi:pyruvate dehydrogenase E1 component